MQDLRLYSPSQLKTYASNGTFASRFAIGDILGNVNLNGTVANRTVNTTVQFRLVDISHNTTYEGNSGRPLFIFNEVFADGGYYEETKVYVEANSYGTCMNRKGQVGNTIDSSLTNNAKLYGPNKGGWASSYMRNTIIPQLLQCIPSAWRDNITSSTIYTDNTGNESAAASAVTSTSDKLYLPSEYELYGACRFANPSENTKQTQIKYFTNGSDSFQVNMVGITTIYTLWYFLRSPVFDNTKSYCLAYQRAFPTSGDAAKALGVRPLFRI